MTEPQTFEDAVAQFKEFLRENGYSANVVWVEPTDLVLPGRHAIYVKMPPPSRNVEYARRRFAFGMSEALGVTFGTICELQNATCCYVWVPKSRTEQQEHLLGPGLKLSAQSVTSRVPGIPVANPVQWQLLKILHRKRSDFRQHLFG
jgi:hypothetical protein